MTQQHPMTSVRDRAAKLTLARRELRRKARQHAREARDAQALAARTAAQSDATSRR
jgi:hypothetical protein